ncbi:aspartyl-phosphate phosphatase Spo0E family protein [Salirhabdus sp. Marseille-P4669]|uniref:aspartyl-phosphate phosphatase Spo0E family protein n=1 Tax=Salirhabdus sp. Marseille-P4669 TaxID=2042310 RepID=UPI000C7CCE2E|nr:aspartyl-phosphate phosphatase Spo0E family protein [Salirhabdus sp. Marseille-P4669]
MGNNNVTPYHKTLRSEIENCRAHLLKIGNELGLTHQETVYNSQVLDELINEYIKSNLKEK